MSTAADTTTVAPGSAARDHGIPFGEAVRVCARVAALSFGRPAGQIAVMHRILMEEKRWIGENRFLYALNYCMLLPGLEAQQTWPSRWPEPAIATLRLAAGALPYGWMFWFTRKKLVGSYFRFTAVSRA